MGMACNYKDCFGFLTDAGYMHLYANHLSENFVNFWEVPNLFLQKFPAESFPAITKLTFTARQGKWIGAKVGLFVVKPFNSGNRGWLDVDWFKIQKSV